MPKTWTDIHIHVSDQLRETILDTEYDILRELALDSLNNPKAWMPIGDRLGCYFLSSDGSPVCVELGVATIDSSLATVYSVHMKDACLEDLGMPLIRIDEFENDYVDTEYQSKALPEQPTFKVRLGKVSRLQPMKYDPEE